MTAKETLSDKRRRAGRAGGLATLANHGPEHMREIGKRGAKTLWKRYFLLPYQTSQYALIDRSTGMIKAIR